MPPNGIFFSARPPIHRSIRLRPVSWFGPGAGAGEERDTVCRCNVGYSVAGDVDIAHHEQRRRVALGFQSRRADHAVVEPVGGDEIDHRCRVLQVGREIDPVVVGLQEGRTRRGVELLAGVVQRRHAGVAAAGDIDRRKVERQPEQVVAQRTNDELVDLVAVRDGHAADDRAGRLIGRDAPSRSKATGLRKASIRSDVRIDRIPGGIEPRHAVGQHRMAEAINGMSELGEDRRIDVGRRVEHEGVDRRLDLAGELLEDEVLVLHLGREARRPGTAARRPR